MAAITTQYTETNLVGNLTAGISSTDTTITATFIDRISGLPRAPQSTTKVYVIDKGTEQYPNPKYEIILAGSVSTNGTTNVTTLTGCTRGLASYGTSTGAGTGVAHITNAEIGCADVHLLWNILSSILDGTNSPTALKLGTRPAFELAGVLGFRVFADATARDAAIVSPQNGDTCYVTALGVAQIYTSGTWTNVGSSTTPNADTTTAGKVEIATQSEVNAGTATGGTGASLVPTPATISTSIQRGSYIYAGTGGTSTAYTLTLTPALTAYTAGQRFYAIMHTTNGPLATLNVNGLGAVTIRPNFNTNLVGGELQAGMAVEFMYDGTLMQMLTHPYGSVNPPGTILMWPTTTAPNGYLSCDGSAISRATYAGLFSVIGTTFGTGDGSTTFNLPSLKGKMPVGLDLSDINFDGINAPTTYVGEKTHTLTTNEMPSHTHTIDVQTTSTSGGTGAVFRGSVAGTATNNTGSAGSGAAHNNMPPYMVLSFIIKF